MVIVVLCWDMKPASYGCKGTLSSGCTKKVWDIDISIKHQLSLTIEEYSFTIHHQVEGVTSSYAKKGMHTKYDIH